MLTIHQIVNNPVSSNCFVLYDKAVGQECVVVDPGSKHNDELFTFLEENGLVPQYIVLTHEHFDHCWGVNELVEKYQVSIVCSELCSECIRFEKRNCSVFYDNKERFIITSRTISVESLDFILPFAGTQLFFFPSPGHTEASICFINGNCLFTGDTLIKDLKTVTKLPTGSKVRLRETMALLNSMKNNGYSVYPGHGEVFLLKDCQL